jgi:glyoxylase-like metal-dependent hydrolase (beta-lactamase superfamily II)
LLRPLLLALLVAGSGGAGIYGCATTAAAARDGTPGNGDAADGFAPLEPVAPGVYVQRGADEAPGVGNRGAVANLGVIVGTTGVVVVNTGSSRAHGAALLARIAQLTSKPVVLAIDTQASPDQVLGNAAFAERGIPILAQRETDTFMREHCSACVADVKSRADTPALAATSIAWPTRLIDGGQIIEAGGRTLKLLYWGWTEQPGSLAVLDVESAVLFTGDLASFDVLPQAQLAHAPEWIAALQGMQQLAPARVVPGHGAPGPATRLQEVAGYLMQLRDRTAEAYRRGDGLLETVESLELPDYRGWALYGEHHRRNVHATYLAIEAQELKR